MLILCHLKSRCCTAWVYCKGSEFDCGWLPKYIIQIQIHNYRNQTQLIYFVVVDPWVRPDMTISNLIQLPMVAHPTCRLVCLLLALPSRPKYQVVHPQLQAGLHSITGSNVTIINQILQCCITRDSRAQPRGAGSKKDLLNYGLIKTGGYPIPFKMKCSYWNGQNRSLKDIFNHR